MKQIRAFYQQLFVPIDIAMLAYFRIAFGLIMLWEVYRYMNGTRIERYWLSSAYHFTYFGFDWVQPWPGDGMYWHFWGLGVLAVLITLGWLYRFSATLFFLGFTYMFLLEKAQYLNHFYLICLISFLMIFVPAHRAWSVDAWLRPRLRRSQVPAWSLYLLRAQIGLVYFFGGVAKLNGDWLRGQPMQMWLASRTDFPLIGPWFTQPSAGYFFSYGGLLFDLLVFPALLWKPTRLLAFLVALGFHLTNARLFSIGIFPWFMIAATVIFFAPDLPRRILQRLMPQSFAEPQVSTSQPAMPLNGFTARQKLILSLLTGYLALQCLIPLRHFLYPGNVSWTEEGHNFAWHMKLRGKSAAVRFFVTDLTSGARTEVDLHAYLTQRQIDKMASRPHMILQFAHFLDEELAKQGQPHVYIQVSTLASLNGREYQPLIDSSVNLLDYRPQLWPPATWIMPLEPSPPGTRLANEIISED